MGLITRHKDFLFNKSHFHRVLYLSIASGFCGSLTTFSSLHLESNKHLIQLDKATGSIEGSFNIGNVLEWLVSMWASIAVSFMSLKLGQHLSEWSPYSNERFNSNGN